MDGDGRTGGRICAARLEGSGAAIALIPLRLREQFPSGANYASSSTGVIETDSPQPQAAVWLGLLNTKRAASLSRTKSISVPTRNRIALGSMKIFTPLSS